MNCEDVVDILQRTDAGADRSLRRAAAEHAAGCESCWHALRAFEALRAERERTVPMIPGGLERALVGSTRTPAGAPARRGGFWLGALVGAAVAASLTAAVLTGIFTGGEPAAFTQPEVRIALNEPQNVSIALDTPVALAMAEIRVTLSGAIELAGFAGQREVRWSTDLASGVNQLTLPVVALQASGGQLSVEVQHGEKRRTFIVDVRSRQSSALPAGA